LFVGSKSKRDTPPHIRQ
jgi:GNAT superfamily N-acetyltransferase